MQRSRAYRRDKLRVRKKQVRERVKQNGWGEFSQRKVGRMSNSRGVCSCSRCKYHRYYSTGIKLKKADSDFKDQLEEL